MQRLAGNQPVVTTPRDLWLLCLAVAFSIRAFLMIRLATLPRALHVGSQRQAPLSEADIGKLARYTSAVVRRLAPDNRCLYRAAGLYQILRRHGHPVRFHLGLRRDSTHASASLQGHAWLSCEGRPYLEAEPGRLCDFVETYSTRAE